MTADDLLRVPESRSERAAVRVLQAGALGVVAVRLPMALSPFEPFFDAPKEALLHLVAVCAALLMLSGARRLAADAADLAVAGVVVLSLLTAASAVNPWLAQRMTAMSVSTALLFWTARTLAGAGYRDALLIAAVGAAALAAVTTLLDAHGVGGRWVSGRWSRPGYSPGGLLAVRNRVAHVVALTLPALTLCALTARRRGVRAFALATLGLSAAALTLTRTRAAWLALALSAVVTGMLVVGVLVARRGATASPLRPARAALAALALLVGVAAAVVPPNRLGWRSRTPYRDSLSRMTETRAGSGRVRLIQYRATLAMAGDHIALGVGPGNWTVHYARYAAPRDPTFDPFAPEPTNRLPTSDWLALLAEQGALAFALVALTGLLLAWRALRLLLGDHQPAESARAVTLLATLSIVAVIGALDALMLLAPGALLVSLLIGALAPRGKRVAAPPLPRPVRLALLAVIALVGGLGTLYSVRRAQAVALFATHRDDIFSVERASRIDPGNYRLHLMLAERWALRGDCARAQWHARAAATLLPHAPAARRVVAQCS